MMDTISEDILGEGYTESEIIIGLVGAVGIDIQNYVVNDITERLSAYEYKYEIISISKNIISEIIDIQLVTEHNEYDRISKYMDAGNKLRKKSGDNSVLALGVAAYIFNERINLEKEEEPLKRQAFIVKSLKHPDEVSRLRKIYSDGFYLIGINMSRQQRKQYLTDDKQISPDDADLLISRDENENESYGQRTRDTFYLSDFFIDISNNREKTKKDIWRIIDIIFGHPYITPTFDEYAMFLAYSASLRSADLSRQVGAIIAKNKELLSTGANDCPQYRGGLYWPDYYGDDNEISDIENGRDYKRGFDSNKLMQEDMIEEIITLFDSINFADDISIDQKKELLKKSSIKNLTEFGRAVHAEMEAILCCARNNISTSGATLYCTTFPCHNCAKHIIAAGIERVVYIEPYPKSKALEFHSDAINVESESEESKKVMFQPFIGVGPRRFFDLFSMNIGSGFPLTRKNKEGKTIKFRMENAKMRIQMLPCSYLEIETLATKLFDDFRRRYGTVQKEE